MVCTLNSQSHCVKNQSVAALDVIIVFRVLPGSAPVFDDCGTVFMKHVYKGGAFLNDS